MTESKYVSAKLRRLVAERANFVCEYCLSQEDFSPESFAVEHIHPRKAGGKNVEENLAYSCLVCNSHKAAKTKAFAARRSAIRRRDFCAFLSAIMKNVEGVRRVKEALDK